RHLLGMAPLAGPERTVLATVHPSSLDQAGTLIRARKGRGDLALLERLVAEAPELAPALDSYADALGQAGRDGEAREAGGRALRAAAAGPELFRLRVERKAYAEAGKTAEMTRIENRIYELVPDDLAAVLAPRGRTPDQQWTDLVTLRKEGSALRLRPELD